MKVEIVHDKEDQEYRVVIHDMVFFAFDLLEDAAAFEGTIGPMLKECVGVGYQGEIGDN